MSYPYSVLEYADVSHAMVVQAAVEKYGMEKLNQYRAEAHQRLLRQVGLSREELLAVTDNMPVEMEPPALAAWLDARIQERLQGRRVDALAGSESRSDGGWAATTCHDAFYLSYQSNPRIVLDGHLGSSRLATWELADAFRTKLDEDRERKAGKEPLDRRRWARAYWELERIVVLAGEARGTAESRLFLQPLLYSFLAGIGVLEPWMRRSVRSLRATVRRLQLLGRREALGCTAEWMEAAAESTLAVLKQYRRTGKWPGGVTLGLYKRRRIIVEPPA